jgi:hypothetical protein
MSRTVIIHGRYVDRNFIPDGPLPEIDGEAELIITPATFTTRRSIADAFGMAPVLRSGDDILAQVQSERDVWGER